MASSFEKYQKRRLISSYFSVVISISLVLFLVNITNYGFNLKAVRELAKYNDDSKKVNALFNEVFSVKLYLTGFSRFGVNNTWF